MSELATVIFHTAPPTETRYPYQKPPYREVVGFSLGGSALWTPRAEDEAYLSESYRVHSQFAQTLGVFFERWFADPSLAWNCHMAAAGMLGIEGWQDEPTARRHAASIVEEGWDGPQEARQLGEGQQGVYTSGQWLEHSVVGLGSDNHIQLNGTNEPYVSILPAAYNHEYSFAQPNARFYTSK